MSGLGGWRLLLRQARADISVLVTLAVLVAVTALLAAAVPRQLNATSDAALAAALDSAPPAAVQITAGTTNSQSSTQLARVDTQLRRRMNPTLTRALGVSVSGATAGIYDSLRPDSGEPFRAKPFSWLQVRYQSDLLEQVRWSSGRPPVRVAAPEGRGDSLPLVQIALARGAADQLDLHVGDRLLLSPIAGRSNTGFRLLVEVSGLFEPLDPDAPAWGNDPLVLEPGQEVSATGELVAEYATALVAEPQLPDLVKATTALTFDWHYPVRPQALDAGNISAAGAGIEQTIAQGLTLPAEVGPLGVPPFVDVSSGLVEIIDTYVEQVATSRAVTSMVLAGLFVLALLVLGLATELGLQRRTESIVLARARGASRANLIGVLGLEALVVTAPAAVAGYLLAVLLVPARPSRASVVLVAALVLGCVGFVAAGGWRAGGTTPADRRRDVVASSRSRRRVSAEVLLMLLGVGGLVLLRRRGLGTGTDGGDPFLATVPVLLALGAGVLALRAYPWVLRPLSRMVGRRAGASSFVAFARASRQPLTSTLPLAVLLLGLGFSVFASAVETTVTDGQRDAAWGAVGADFRLDGYAFDDVQLSAVAATDGVVDSAAAFIPEDAEVADADGSRSPVRLVALEPAAYADVVAGAPPELVPRAGLGELATRTASPGALAALVSPRVAAEAREGLVTVDLGAGVGEKEISVSTVANSFPTDAGGDFVILDLGALRAGEETPLRVNTVFVRAPASAAAGLESTVRRFGAEVAIEGRAQLLADTAEVPLVEGTTTVFRLGVLVAALYCLLAVLLALVLSAQDRARLLATLRTLGIPRGSARALLALELAPMVVAVVLAGLAVGVALPYLLVPVVDLTSFTGGSTSPAPRLDPYVTAGLALGLVAVVVAAVAVISAVQRRHPLAEATRTAGA